MFFEKKKKKTRKKTLGHQYQQEAEIGYYILSSHNLNVRQSCINKHTYTHKLYQQQLFINLPLLILFYETINVREKVDLARSHLFISVITVVNTGLYLDWLEIDIYYF